MRHWLLAALAMAVPVFAQASAAPACVNAGTWTYAGIGKGGTTTHETATSTTLEFTPDAKAKGADAAFAMTIDAGAPGVYQINADFDVRHLSEDGLFTLVGATSAIPGRDFDVKIAKGDDGVSSFSRPVTTTGKPFRIVLHGKGVLSVTVRNVKICRLR